MNLIPSPSRRDADSPRRWFETGVSAQEDAARHVEPKRPQRKRTLVPKAPATLEFPLLLDDLSSTGATAHAAHAGAPEGVRLGRLHVHEGASAEEAGYLAAMSASRHAILRAPYGGAAATLRASGRQLSRAERERLARRLARELAAQSGWASTILLTDVELPDEETRWLCDEAHVRRGTDENLSPRERAEGFACLPMPRASVGEGVRILAEEALALERTELEGARVAVHGNGALGQATTAALARAGARVVAVTEGATTFYHPAGLDPTIIPQLTSARGALRIPGMLQLPAASILQVPCEALVLTRLLARVGPQYARRVGARVVLEADDGLLSPEADVHLLRRGARVVPDMLGALPAEILGDLQWQQYVTGERWSRREVETRLETHLREAFARADDLATGLSITLRRAAHILAVEQGARAPI